MNRTWITARLIALVLAAGVVACGSQTAPTPAPPSPTVDRNQLSVFERLPSSVPSASGPASPEILS